MQFLEVTSPAQLYEHRLGGAPLTGDWDQAETPEPRLHRIHAYPAKFPAFLTERALAYGAAQGLRIERVGDVFCGCGTVAHEARRSGLAFWGCDINPVATLIARTKSMACSGAVVRRRGTVIAAAMRSASRRHGLTDAAARRLRRWFTPKAFEDLARLRNAIEAVVPASSKYRSIFYCAFSAILKSCSQWQQRSIKPALDPYKAPQNVHDAFLAQVEWMALAFEEAGVYPGPSPDIRHANVLNVAPPPQLIDLIVTSPPYVTSYEYADLHQLSSLWLGYTDDHRELRQGSIGSSQHALNLKRAHSVLNRTGRQIVFTLYPEDRVAAEAVANYYLDMQRVAERCREFLSAQGVAVFVIGNTRYRDVDIDNASHLTEALLQAGFGSVRATRRRISNKCATPFRDGVGRYTRSRTARPLYAEEFVLIAHP